MTILDKIRKARELAAAMDAAIAEYANGPKTEEAHAKFITVVATADAAGWAVVRDDELLELGEEVERLRELNDKFKWQVRDTCQRAEAAEVRLHIERTLTDEAMLKLQAAEAKLAAAEGDARRYRKGLEDIVKHVKIVCSHGARFSISTIYHIAINAISHDPAQGAQADAAMTSRLTRV